MARVCDCYVLLSLGSWNALVKNEFAPVRHRVRVAERSDKWLGEFFQHFPCGLVFGDRSMLRRNRNQRRKAARACLERFVRKWCVVRRLLGLAQAALASHSNDLPDGQNRNALAE